MNKIVKKAVVIVAATAITFGTIAATSTTIMANTNSQTISTRCVGRGNGMMLQGMMRDNNGNFLTREAFEARLDSWIRDGIINERDRTFFLDRFDWCFENGGGAIGPRGGCGNNRGNLLR